MFEQMNHYGKIRKEWLESTGYGELGLEFINPGTFIGSFGNPLNVEMLLKANQLGLRPNNKPVLLLHENSQLTNAALFSYFEPFLCLKRDKESIASMSRLESLLTLPLGTCLPMNDDCPFSTFVANRIEAERIRYLKI